MAILACPLRPPGLSETSRMRASSSMSPALRNAFVARLRFPDGPSELSMVKAERGVDEAWWGGGLAVDAIKCACMLCDEVSAMSRVSCECVWTTTRKTRRG